MMKHFTFKLLSGALLLAACPVSAQKAKPAFQPCGTQEIMELDMQKNPELRMQYNDFMKQLSQITAAATPSTARAEKRIIPVVFHVIHQCGPENISKEQILDQIRILNDDFAKLNATINQTPECHAAVAADCNIEFRLATKDDQGNCTDGIVRVASPKTYEANNDNGVKAVSRWNSDKYLNVWVVNSIGSVQGTGGEVLGYAQFPFGGLLSTDGVVLRYDCVGSIGAAQTGPFAPRFGRTMTHEVGHWLGLRHIWGDADCGSDGVDDTPIAQEPNYGVCWSDFPYHLLTCSSDSTDECGEMFMNYMDYSDDQCMSMFTLGQKAVMDATLASFRYNISSEINLAATGTRDEDIANPVVCVPFANFCDNRRLVCAGSSVTFEDASYNAATYTRSWNFEGGTPATSTAVSPSVTYDAAGLYDVSLTSTSTAGENTNTKNDHILVSPSAAQYGQGPFEENFENAGTMNDFVIFNTDGSNAKWEYTTQAGFGSSRSVRMRNFLNTATESDDLITPSYNLTTVTSPSLLFRVACAERGGEPTDQLKIYFSSNCGQTWGSPRILNFSDFNTAGLYTSEFVPTNASQWKTFAFSMASLASQENVRIRFEYVAGTGDRANNLYLDDINIGNALGVNDLGYDLGLSVFPNPTTDQTNVVFETAKPTSIAIRVFDILGKEVTPVFNGNVGTGTQNFSVNMSQLSTGLYTIRLDIDGTSVYRKVIKK